MRLNKNGWYLIEASHPTLEAIDQEDMEALFHFIVKEEVALDCIMEAGIDQVVTDFFIELANSKLEDLKEELRENPPVYTEEENRIRRWMHEELQKKTARR